MKYRHSVQLTLIVLTTITRWCYGYPEGAPTSVCMSLQPGTQQGGASGIEGHIAKSQNEVQTYGNSASPPYYIQVQREALKYTAGQSYRVSIVANQTKGATMYKGIFLMARQVECVSPGWIEANGGPIGRFSVTKPGLLQTIKCANLEDSAVTHNSPQYKINETIVWHAPETMSGNIIFKATIVQLPDTYWMEVYSSVLRDTTTTAPVECSAMQPVVQLMTTLFAVFHVRLVTRLLTNTVDNN